ncbi:MAG: peptidoglycan-binding protein, and OmpA, partial [Deltaproteobacteria bacterium]|nr:peptidoglycan-binding protein, and OmpA [Deltaproteobacteria bacterium]
TVEKAAFTDYTLDYEAGSILFKEPVPSLDSGMNPVYIVALYESEGTNGEFYTYGGRAAVKPWTGLEVGATAVREDRDLESATLTGVDATLKVGKSLKVTAETAETDTAESGKGTAWRVEAAGAPTRETGISAYYRNVEKEFRNLSAQSAEPGTVKYGAKADYRLTSATAFKADGYVQENDTAGTKLTSLEGSVAHGWDNVAVETGYRNLRDEKGGGDEGESDSHMAFASVSNRLTERATATLKHSQILSGEGIDQYETETAATLEYRLTEAVKANVTGNYQWTGEKRRAVLFGLETQITKSTVLTSRYEIEDTVSGERLQSLIGLNHQWSPRKDLKLDGRVEWIDYQKGANDTGAAAAQEGIAMAVAAEYLPREDVKATGRTEVRFGDLEDTTLLGFGVGWKVTQDMGLLARANLWNADRDAGSASKYDVLAGVAYRPKGSRSIYLLDTVRYIAERDGADGGTDSKRVITSNDISWRVHPRLTLSGKYAGKYAWDRYEGDDFGTYSDLAVAGVGYDLTDRWDVGAQAQLMTQYSTDARELSALVRTGYRIVKNLYLGAGYNFARMNDGDFSGSGWQSHGPFIELKLKFDEATLHLPGWDKKPAPPPCAPKPILAAPSFRQVEQDVDVVGSVEMPAFLVNGSEVPLPSGDAFLLGHLPDGSLRFEGSEFLEPAKFQVEPAANGTPSAWKLSVLDAGGTEIRSLAGAGAPPSTIPWDGRTEEGKTVEGGALYRYRLDVSYADNSVASGGTRDFAVNRVSSISLNLTGSAFKSGSDILSERAKKALREMAAVLKKRPEERVTVEGHTDHVGTDEYNMDLSRRRAQAAADYLVRECGVPAERFTVLWYGESRPMAPNDSPEGREINRRVELRGEFQETQRAAATDRYRTEPTVRINGASYDVDPVGRFRTKLPSGTERIDLDMTAADGRSVRTSFTVPAIRVEPASGTDRIAVPAIRVEPASGTDRIAVTGWTEPGNTLERDGKPVPVGLDGSFSETIDVPPGGARVGFVAKSPAGVTRILHLDLGVSGGQEKAAVAQ